MLKAVLAGIGSLGYADRPGNMPHKRQANLLRFLCDREVCVPWYSVIHFDKIGSQGLQRLHSLPPLSRVANWNRVLRMGRFGTVDQRAGCHNLRSHDLA